MRLRITCAALLAGVAACLSTAAIALAASAPSVAATKATDVTTRSAVLNATVTPNGAKTTYYFSYGPTPAYGFNSPQKSVAAGSRATPVHFEATGLLSGTTYYYDLTAVNVDGTSVTKQITFTTAGHAPAQATTGGATVLSATSMTFTGSIDTQNADTTYYFLYGTTPQLGEQTQSQIATASNTATAVSSTATGLTPGTVFYYELVAQNGPTDSSHGAQGSAETFPDPVPKPRVVASTTPRAPRRGPYVLTTHGRIEYTNKTNPGLACAGTAEASYYYGHRLVFRQAVPTDATNCTFALSNTFKQLPVKGHRTEKLTLYIRFSGNHYFRGVVLKPETVTLG